jgi:hypothetical protein
VLAGRRASVPVSYFPGVHAGAIAARLPAPGGVIYDIRSASAGPTSRRPKHRASASVGSPHLGIGLNCHYSDHAGVGISIDRNRWVTCRPNFLLAVDVLSCLFRRLVLAKLATAHLAGELQFFGKYATLTNARAFARYLTPLRNADWVVYAKRPFGGPRQVLRYLARYTHRVAISNRRLVSLDDKGVTFKWKDYRLDGPERQRNDAPPARVYSPLPDHVLPRASTVSVTTAFSPAKGAPNHCPYPRIASGAAHPHRCHQGIERRTRAANSTSASLPLLWHRMRIIEIFRRGQQPKHYPTHDPTRMPAKIRCDTS